MYKYRCITQTTTLPFGGDNFRLLANCFLLLFCNDLTVFILPTLLAGIRTQLKVGSGSPPLWKFKKNSSVHWNEKLLGGYFTIRYINEALKGDLFVKFVCKLFIFKTLPQRFRYDNCQWLNLPEFKYDYKKLYICIIFFYV